MEVPEGSSNTDWAGSDPHSTPWCCCNEPTMLDHGKMSWEDGHPGLFGHAELVGISAKNRGQQQGGNENPVLHAFSYIKIIPEIPKWTFVVSSFVDERV